jgi:hypothetical protein
MPAVGKVTVVKVGNDIVVSDESGASYTFPGPTGRPLLLDIDPRIDLTKPIYEQAMKLQAKDKAAAARQKKRKRQAAIA